MVALPSGQALVSCSYSNITPWDSPRELPEEELYAKLRELMETVEQPGSCVLNAHVPPFDSGLDRAAELDSDFRPVLKGGAPHEIPVGSHAVRQIIEEYQPLLAVHGHIHECRGRRESAAPSWSTRARSTTPAAFTDLSCALPGTRS